MRANRPNPLGFGPLRVLVAVLLFAGLLLITGHPLHADPSPDGGDWPGNPFTTLWDFESGPQDFWGTGDWEWGTPNGGGPKGAHSGSYCWGTNQDGPYTPSAYCYLYSPELEVLTRSALLRFANWFEFEDGFDGGQVFVSAQGTGWTLIEPVGGYPGEIELESGHTVPAFTGLSEGWEEPTFDLGPFQGQRVTIQFRMTTNSTIQMGGWFIDDVRLANVVSAYTADVEGDGDSPKRGGLPGGDESGMSVLDLAPGLPNPFREETRLRFAVPDGAGMADTRLEILSVTGRLVTVLADGKRPAGEHVLSWNGRDATGRAVPPGIYFAHLVVGEHEATRRIVRLE
jgi:hypothetical protein